jgi:hypothetical protein
MGGLLDAYKVLSLDILNCNSFAWQIKIEMS